MATAALLAVLAACTNDDPYAALKKPDPVDVDETTTTSEVDLTGAPLAPVAGSTTTTVALGPGPITIVGKVEGPEGVVAGAVVQLERLVGDRSAGTRVPTAADGTWNVEKVLGGRYRIRAWRTPDLATSRPVIVFIESGPSRAVDITVELVGGIRVDAAMAPDPPVVDEPANLKVRVAERTVDGEGIVRDTPVTGVFVSLSGTGDWSVDSPNPALSGGDGSVVFRVTCEDDGVQPLFATIEGDESYALAIQPCFDPSATTTTSTETSSTSSTTSTTEP